MVRMYNGVPVGSDVNSDVVSAIDELIQKVDTLGYELKTQFGPLLANGYKVLSLDLGTARTDEKVAENVVGFTILDISSGATASLKLFSTSNDAIVVPDDLGPGDGISYLQGADLYVSNTAQSGATLKLIVLTRG